MEVGWAEVEGFCWGGGSFGVGAPKQIELKRRLEQRYAPQTQTLTHKS